MAMLPAVQASNFKAVSFIPNTTYIDSVSGMNIYFDEISGLALFVGYFKTKSSSVPAATTLFTLSGAINAKSQHQYIALITSENETGGMRIDQSAATISSVTTLGGNKYYSICAAAVLIRKN